MKYKTGDLLQSIHHPDSTPCIIREVIEIRQYRAGSAKYKVAMAYSISGIDEINVTFIVTEKDMPTRFIPLETKDVEVS